MFLPSKNNGQNIFFDFALVVKTAPFWIFFTVIFFFHKTIGVPLWRSEKNKEGSINGDWRCSSERVRICCHRRRPLLCTQFLDGIPSRWSSQEVSTTFLSTFLAFPAFSFSCDLSMYCVWAFPYIQSSILDLALTFSAGKTHDVKRDV